MKSVLLAFTIVCLAVESAASHERASKAVEQTFTRFIAAFNNLDWDAFHGTFADDVTVFNPDIPEAPSVDRIDGREQVEDGFRSVFDATRKQASGPPYLHIVPKNVRTQMYGKVAIVTFEFDRADNTVGRRTIVFVLERNEWRIVHIHASNAPRRP